MPSRFFRAFRRRNVSTIGNYWVDLTRGTLYILLPLAVLVSLILMSQGVVQTIAGYPTVTSALDGAQQTLARGPAAFQVAIKQLGTNGGGFFNTNSAHPFENPTPFSNIVETWSIIAVSAAFPFLFGRYVRKFRQGLVDLRRDGDHLHRRPPDRLSRRAGRRADARGYRRLAGAGQHGGQGSPLRHRALRDSGR